MKKKSTSQSAFFKLRLALGLCLGLTGVLLALVAFGALSPASAQSNRSGPVTDGPSRSSDDLGAADAQLSAADAHGRFVYMIEFAEPGMLRRETRGPRERFNPNTPQAQASHQQIVREQSGHVQAMASALGRSLDVTHHFVATESGIATRLTPEEAQIVRGLSQVKSVERERVYHTTTYSSPKFIGADKIWDGTAVPPGSSGTKGEGIVIAMLDTGLDPNHPSFANDPACGHGGANPNKLISALDCASTDGNGLCNGPDPTDSAGHGTHTSSTAGGDTVTTSANPPPLAAISGMAPCANIRSYKVCPTDTCPGSNIQAGMDSVLLQGDASVMNFSISGGTDPWNDNDRKKLDLVDAGVLVAASAGNTSTSIPDPVGQVNHRGPWILTVAASTKDSQLQAVLSATGPGSPPPDLQGLGLDIGSASPEGSPLNNFPIRHFTGQDIAAEGCSAQPPFPPGFFNGAVALIRRGTCPFTEKITNAFNAGAAMVVIRNNQTGSLSMDTTGQPAVPAYSIANQVTGDALNAFVDANPSSATISFEPHGIVSVQGDVLASFSLRGPDPSPLQNLTKPDITGPGVNIYAAMPLAFGGYGNLSGTSMSSPHAAGSAALVRAVRPDWTVTEVKSAMMMTSFEAGTKEDGVTPWNADDVGNGRLDLSKAALAGLVMDETTQHFIDANPAVGGDVRTLNLPAVRDMACTPNCSWTRTVRNTLPQATTWTATGTAITPGFNVTVSPSNFSFSGGIGETKVLTITATPTTNLTSAVAFGKVTLHENASASPDEHLSVAIKGEGSAGGEITLQGRPRQGGHTNVAVLFWRGANSTNVDVYRDGHLIMTAPNTGKYIDDTGADGRIRYHYRVCEAGTQTCSNITKVKFP